MKRLVSILMVIMLMVFAAGCGSSGSSGSSTGSEPAAQQESSDTASASDNSGSADAASSEDSAEADTASDPGVDVDLSALSTTMVYGQVYDMLTKPDDFMGKTIKASGIFAVYTDEQTGKNYYACIIQDATACCQQGLEFELKGKHDYPADYPEVGSEVTVVGTFDTYEENGSRYCTLRKAKFV